MKRVKTILILLFAASTFLGAQPKIVNHPVKLIDSEAEYFMRPEWSPNGEMIAFTAEKNNGLWISNEEGKHIEQLTSDENAGFGFSWSADSKTILARPVEIENDTRYNVIKLYDIETKQETEIIGKSRSLRRLPVWSDNDSRVAVLIDNNLEIINSGKPQLKSANGKITKALVFGGELTSSTEAAEKPVSFKKFEGRYIFNSETSPDGKKIVFQVSGLGLYVSNIDGTDLKHLEYAEQASWMPDNKFIIATNVKDDGMVITAGELSAINVESGASFPLMINETIIALNPSVSPDGKKILFDNPTDGAIYMMEIK
ncbi:MAG: DPP IV N-terminal domain-containing protein [Bacteroidota bacterium]